MISKGRGKITLENCVKNQSCLVWDLVLKIGCDVPSTITTFIAMDLWSVKDLGIHLVLIVEDKKRP